MSGIAGPPFCLLTNKIWPGILLTITGESLRSPGQIALPGGAADRQRFPHRHRTAQAREEVGIPPQAMRVLGQMAPVDSVTGFGSPVVSYSAISAAGPVTRRKCQIF